MKSAVGAGIAVKRFAKHQDNSANALRMKLKIKEGDIMKLKLLVMVAAISVSACNSTTQSGSDPAVAAAEQKYAECEAQTFKTRVAYANCMNDGRRMLLPGDGADADLRRMVMAKEMEVAERVDRKRLTIAQANLELAQFRSQVQAEYGRRQSVRLATVSQMMQANNTMATNNSIAYSTSRIANATEQMANPPSRDPVNAIFTPIQQLNNRMGAGY